MDLADSGSQQPLFLGKSLKDSQLEEIVGAGYYSGEANS
jgi:hypothetical protein